MANPSPSGRELAGVLALLLVLAGVVYGNSLSGEFLNWDDPKYVLHNAELQQPTAQAVGTIFSTFHFTNYNPLQRLSFLVDMKLFGASATAFRTTNLLLHVAAAFLLFLLLHVWLGRRVPAVLAAALFVVHPANVENVAWISERKTLLATCFAFGSALAWMRAGHGWRAGRPVALVLFTLGMLAKTSIVLLPALLALHDITARQRLQMRWYAALLAPAVALSMVQILASTSSDAIRGLHGGSLASHAGTVIGALPAYAFALLDPFGHSPRHLFDPVTSVADPRPWGGLVLLAVAGFGALRSWRGERRLAMALAWCFAALLPTLIVPIPIILADRYLYLAMPLLLGLGVDALWMRRPPAAVPVRVGLALACGVFALATFGYAGVWRDSRTLWTHALEREPADRQAWVSLGEALAAAGDAAAACKAYEAVLRIDPQYHDAAENLAVLLLRRDDRDRARALLENVVASAPQRGSGWAALAAVLALQGHETEAAEVFARGLKRLPEHPGLLHNLAQFHLQHGRHDQAAAVLRSLLAAHPGDGTARQSLAELERMTAGDGVRPRASAPGAPTR